MNKLTHNFNDAKWRVHRETGASLSFLHKAFLNESMGGSRAVSAYRFSNEMAAHYHPAKKPMMAPAPAPRYWLH